MTSFNKEEAENIFGKDVVEKILTDQNIKEISYNIYCNKKPKEKQINLIKSTKLESNDLIFKRKDGSNIDVNINKTLCYTSNFGIDYSCFSIDNFINTYYTDDIKQKEDERTIYNKNNEEMMEKYKQFQEQYKKKGKKSKKSE
ncbi:MAG: hypothetical protein A2139_02995 [Desulfobacca sp. RBG_16_60_12]|nr:MAG: hypothetical protein A2139_02995 [Desulfobacca sp. RBG_16_60_12]